MRALVGGKAIHDMAVEPHRAALVLQGPAHAVDQRRFAGTVRPDQADALAGLDRQVDAVERDEAAEALAQILDLEQRLGHQRAPGRMFAKMARRERQVGRPPSETRSRMKSCTRPMMPLGATMTNPTRRRPTISRLTADEMVTVATCCSVPSSSAPTKGPTQRVVPPIIGMAMELTA